MCKGSVEDRVVERVGKRSFRGSWKGRNRGKTGAKGRGKAKVRTESGYSPNQHLYNGANSSNAPNSLPEEWISQGCTLLTVHPQAKEG